MRVLETLKPRLLLAAHRWEGPAPVGIRSWQLSISDGLLYPFTRMMRVLQPDPWKTTVAVASCARGDRPPCLGHPCGLYAVRPGAWDGISFVPDVSVFASVIVVGVVSLFGRVIEHKDGWRAERARIREVWVPVNAEVCFDAYPGVTFHRV